MSKRVKRGEGPFILENSDGCSGISILYRKITKLIYGEERTLPFLRFCHQHDERYFYGGTRGQRKYADYDLHWGIKECGLDQNIFKRCFYWIFSYLVLLTVRVLGSPDLPTPFRWAHGEKYTGRYQYTYFDRKTQNQTVKTELEAEIVMNIVESDHLPEVNTITEAVAIITKNS